MKIDSPVLKRLGPVPFWRGTKKCIPELDLVYRRARQAAEKALSSENSADLPARRTPAFARGPIDAKQVKVVK